MPGKRDQETFVVVGGGLAAATAVTGLREAGFEGRLVLVGQEAHLPYERPPLSKGYLLGKDPLDGAFVHPAAWYAEHDVETRLGTRVGAVDTVAHTVATDGGVTRYDRLLLATGASPRRLAMADDSGIPVAYLRTIDDSDRLKSALEPWRHLLVVGGGWIGLEVAAAAREAGAEVVLVESADEPLSGALGPEVGRIFAGLHREHGVDLRTGTGLSSLEHRTGGSVATLEDGSTATTDLVVVAIGATPDTALAEQAGLEVDDGIVVDEYLRTSDPDVFAAGDAARAYHPTLGRHVRVEHWDNAIGQGEAVARSMLDDGEPYTRMPYFYTDQYDLGMEYVGHVGPGGADEVLLRGDVDGRVFTAFWLSDGAVAAGMHVNDWDAIDPVRAIVGADRVDLARLRDEDTPLDQVVP